MPKQRQDPACLHQVKGHWRPRANSFVQMLCSPTVSDSMGDIETNGKIRFRLKIRKQEITANRVFEHVLGPIRRGGR